MALFSHGASASLNYLFDILPLGRYKETTNNMFVLLGCVHLRGKKWVFSSVPDLGVYYIGSDVFPRIVMSSTTCTGKSETKVPFLVVLKMG